MPERIYYLVNRVCNRGVSVSGAAAMNADSIVARVGCPVEQFKAMGSVEGDIVNQSTDEMEYNARMDALKNIDGWCEDPCGLCGAKATIGSLRALIDTDPFDV